MLINTYWRDRAYEEAGRFGDICREAKQWLHQNNHYDEPIHVVGTKAFDIEGKPATVIVRLAVVYWDSIHYL